MRSRTTLLGLAPTLLAALATADEISIPIEGEVPEGEETHFFLPFEVPEGVAEIEVRHSDLSDANILDWGLDDPNGFRGWGGGNTEPAIVGVDAASRSYVPGPIPVGTWEVVVGKAKINELPARYAVEVILRTTPTLEPQTERSPYVESPPLENGPGWYAGDFHVHSRESGDAQPFIEEVLAETESRGLDFVLLSEHNTTSQLSWYASAQATSDVLLIPGAEFTTYAGHANAIGTTEWVDHRIGVRGATIEESIADIHAQGGLVSINHPSVPGGDICTGCPWEIDVDPRTIDGVEILSAAFGGIPFWEELLDAGSHAAAIGGSDDHRAGQGSGIFYEPIGIPTTMVLAENLSVPAILDGIRAGRTVVKYTGPDAPMIETAVLPAPSLPGGIESAALRATVTDGLGKTLQVVKNGAVIDSAEIDADPFVFDTQIEIPRNREDRYRHQAVVVVTPSFTETHTVASHVFVPEPAQPLLVASALLAIWRLGRPRTT